MLFNFFALLLVFSAAVAQAQPETPIKAMNRRYNNNQVRDSNRIPALLQAREDEVEDLVNEGEDAKDDLAAANPNDSALLAEIEKVVAAFKAAHAKKKNSTAALHAVKCSNSTTAATKKQKSTTKKHKHGHKGAAKNGTAQATAVSTASVNATAVAEVQIAVASGTAEIGFTATTTAQLAANTVAAPIVSSSD